jgi:hypothetical protein
MARADAFGFVTPTQHRKPNSTASVPPRSRTPAHVPARNNAPKATCAARKRRNSASLDANRSNTTFTWLEAMNPPASRAKIRL